MRVLVTRPAEDQARTAAALEAAGHEPVAAPLFVIQALPHQAPADADLLLATSANALRHLRLEPEGQALLSRPLLAVGGATAAEARRRGFADVRAGDGDSRDLAALAEAATPGGRLLYLAGRPRRDAALQALSGRFDLITVETYETVAVEELPDSANAALAGGAIDAVLHFSPRAAEVFEALVAKAGLMRQAAALRQVFISPAAERLAFTTRKIAARPNLAAMIAALAEPFGGLD
jgi:uroporphyrinogen-III synthase